MPSDYLELRNLLEDFAYRAIKDKPSDLVTFGLEFFQKIKAQGGKIEPKQEEKTRVSDSEDADVVHNIKEYKNKHHFKARRGSIAGASYNPEDMKNFKLTTHHKTEEQKERLSEIMKTIFMFRSLDKNQIKKIINAMQEKKVEPEEIIIRQGDDGDNFYVIENGIYEIIVNGESAGQYNNVGSFGELALMYNTQRAATIKAKTPGILWVMDRDTFMSIVLKAVFKKRENNAKLLSSFEILQELSEYERTNVADALYHKTYQDGDYVVKQGDSGDEMYFVEEGALKATVTDLEGKEKQVREYKQGDYFGELAILCQGKRQASVYACGDVKLAVLDVHSFERLMGPCINIMKRQKEKYRDQLVTLFGEGILDQHSEMIETRPVADTTTTA